MTTKTYRIYNETTDAFLGMACGTSSTTAIRAFVNASPGTDEDEDIFLRAEEVEEAGRTMLTYITSKSTGALLWRGEECGESAMDAMLKQTGIEFRAWEHRITRAS